MHFIIMSYLVSDTNRTPKVQLYVAVRIVCYDSDDINSSTYSAITTVSPVHISFVSNPWARIVLTEDTFESKILIFLWIELNSIRFGGNIRIRLQSGNHVLHIVNVFFSDRNNT